MKEMKKEVEKVKNDGKVQEDEKMQEDKKMKEAEKEKEGSAAAACNTAGSVIILRRREGGGRRAAGRPHLMRSKKESTVSLLLGSAPGSPSWVLSAEAPAPGRMMKPRATARPEASSVVPRK